MGITARKNGGSNLLVRYGYRKLRQIQILSPGRLVHEQTVELAKDMAEILDESLYR